MGLPGLKQYYARINGLAQGHNRVTPVRLEPTAAQSQVKHSTTEPLRSQMPFDAFANRADSDQAALMRAARSGFTLFAY